MEAASMRYGTHGLLDGLHRGQGLDPMSFERRMGLIHFYAPDGDPEPDAGGGGDPEPTPDPDPDPDEITDVDPEKFKKVLADRSRKNKELIAAQKLAADQAKRIADFEAAEEKRKLADMTETEKEKKRADDAEAARDAAIAESEKKTRLLTVREGKTPEIQEYLQQLLANAQALDGHDDAKWLEGIKESNPEFFATLTPPPNTSGGPQNRGGSELAQIKNRIAEIRAMPFRSEEDRVALLNLNTELRRAERKGV